MRSAAATAPRPRTRAATAPSLSRTPRRVSGPVRPRTAPRPVAAPGAFSRVRGLPESRALDRLLHGRAWIWLIGGALMGIVAMQVSLLKLNTGISRAVQTSATLEQSNAKLERQIARAASSERISRIALERGMIAPSAGTVVYLRARPDADAMRAVEHMGPPSPEARQLAAAPATGTATAATTTSAPTNTPVPEATTAPAEPTGVAAAPTPGQG